MLLPSVSRPPLPFPRSLLLLLMSLTLALAANNADPRDTFVSSTLAMLRLLRTEMEVVRIFQSEMARHTHQDGLTAQLTNAVQQVAHLAQLRPEDLTEEELEVRFAHPINSLSVIRGWAHVSDLMLQMAHYPVVQAIQTALVTGGHTVPQQADLTAMIECLLRLQVTYQLPAHSMAQGIVAGSRSMEALPPADLYRLARASFHRRHYSLTADWLQLVEPQDLLRLPAWMRRDLHLLHYWLARNASDYTEAERRIELANEEDEFGDSVVRNQLVTFKQQLINHQVEPLPLEPAPSSEEYDRYRELCRGEVSWKKTRRPVLCRLTGTYPYVLYKQEVFSVRPWVSFFHDVITDAQIALLKRLATPKLFRSDVGAAGIDLLEYRTSNTAWVFSGLDPAVRQITHHVSAMTQLNVRDMGRDNDEWMASQSTAESFQVLNYGFGGHYVPHIDHLQRGADVERFGERIATFMFYLSDVAAGGATVFTDLGIRVPPKKYGAAFWYNVNRSGAFNYDTVHAGCPVLLGHKWVGNKWIRFNGQMNKRPCGLHLNATTPYRL